MSVDNRIDNNTLKAREWISNCTEQSRNALQRYTQDEGALPLSNNDIQKFSTLINVTFNYGTEAQIIALCTLLLTTNNQLMAAQKPELYVPIQGLIGLFNTRLRQETEEQENTLTIQSGASAA